MPSLKRILTRLGDFAISGQIPSGLRQHRRFPLPSVSEPAAKTTVLFIVANEDIRSGGILSIYNIADKTAKILPDAEIRIVTFGAIQLLYQPKWFRNDFQVYSLVKGLKRWSRSENLIMHCPEAILPNFLRYIQKNGLTEYCRRATLNILNQNARLMPADKYGFEAKGIFREVTMTLAFKVNEGIDYPYLEQPAVYISSGFYGDEYRIVPFEKKEDICIISPDPSPFKDRIVRLLEDAGIRCVRFTRMPFHEFVDLQHRSKWTISFGEGYDGYSSSQFPRGGIGFGVYDEKFFPKFIDPENLPPYFFRSYEEMERLIVERIKALDNAETFKREIDRMVGEIVKLNTGDIVEKGLRQYYGRTLRTRLD